MKKSKLLPSLITKEQRERFAHLLRIADEGWEWIAHIALFKRATEQRESQEWFALGHKKGKSMKSCQKHTKNMNFIKWIACFREWFPQIMSKSLMLLFFTECWERFAHGHSFVMDDGSKLLILKSDKSNLLPFDLFKRAMRTNCSQLPFNMSGFKEQIPNNGSCVLYVCIVSAYSGKLNNCLFSNKTALLQ